MLFFAEYIRVSVNKILIIANMSSPPRTPNTTIALDSPPGSPQRCSTPDFPPAPSAPRKERVEKKKIGNIRKLVLPNTSASEEEEEIEETRRVTTELRRQYPNVREKYLQYSVGYVELYDRETLHQLRKWYNPQSQPRNDEEWEYVFGVLHAVEEQLRMLQCTCRECSNLFDGVSDEDLFNYM